MFSSLTSKRFALALGLAGLIGAASTSTASAGFHFGGGHFGGFHFSAPRIAMPRIAAPRFGGTRIGGGFHQRRFGGLVRPLGHHVAGLRHEPRIKIGHYRPGCRHGYCGVPAVRIATRLPIYEAPPVRPVYEAPVSRAPFVGPPVTQAAPVVGPSKTCVAGGTFLTIGFKPNASVADVAAFLKEYDIVVADGPNADGAFRVRLSAETQSLEKFGPMIESMKTKEIVATIAG